MSSIEINTVRRQFPALAREVNGRAAVYFDGPAGSQTPQRVIDAIGQYMIRCNANHGAVFTTSRESDALLDEAHRAVADLLGAPDPDLVAFGANMTTLTFALSRALAKTWKPGDEIVVTRLDHDGNVTPWVLAARDAGAVVKHANIHAEDCTLDLDSLVSKLSSHTRLVAVGCASNAVGTINPVKRIIELAHAAGAQVFLDAVHHAPHAAMDVADWDCDYLACSAYKFFGPHVGILYGKRSLLTQLPAYKLRPASDDLPGRWMTGTPSHEGIAGTLASVEYLADLGRSISRDVANRRAALLAAYAAIQAQERELGSRLIAGLKRLPQFKIWGITDPERFADRVPTIAITHARMPARAVAEHLNRHGIFVWHGNFYALSLTETLGLEPEGMVRIGLLHYNTVEEVDRLLSALAELE
jgi:cysteine desulfurase family protein (TIGR01976 family)